MMTVSSESPARSVNDWSDDSLTRIGLAATKLTPDRVRAAIATAGLTYREIRILELRYATAEGRRTLEEVGRHFNVSGPRIREIQTGTLRKICLQLSPSSPSRNGHEPGREALEALEVGVRSYNCLKRAGIHTIEDLIGRTRGDLRSLPNFGETSLAEVEECLASRGLVLADKNRLLEDRVKAVEENVRRLLAAR